MCVCVLVCVRKIGGEWAVDSGLFLGSAAHSLGPSLIHVIGSGGFEVADGTELGQVAHTAHTPWRADGRKVKEP